MRWSWLLSRMGIVHALAIVDVLPVTTVFVYRMTTSLVIMLLATHTVVVLPITMELVAL